MAKTLQQLGIQFHYNADFRHYVPSVDAVLFVLGLAKKDSRNPLLQMGPVYTANVHRAAVAVSFDILSADLSEEQRTQVIARTILDLCSPEAQCLFINGFVEAQRLVGGRVPSPNTDESGLIDACTCPYHMEYKQQRALSTD